MINSIQSQNINPKFKGLIVTNKSGDMADGVITTQQISEISPVFDQDDKFLGTKVTYGPFRAFNSSENAQGYHSKPTAKYFKLPVEYVIAAYQEAETNGIAYLYKPNKD